jgi:hypothetical protein
MSCSLGPAVAGAIDKVSDVSVNLNQFGQHQATIVVEHNGTKYDKITTDQLSWDLRVGAKCIVGNKIRQAQVFFGNDNYHGGLAEAGGTGDHSQSVPHFAIDREMPGRNETLKVPKAAFSKKGYLLNMDPIKTCNFLLDGKKGYADRTKMLTEGETTGPFDQNIGFAVRCQTENGSSLQYWDNANKTAQVQLMCKGQGGVDKVKAPPKSPGVPGPKNLASKAVVTKALMSLHPGDVTGTCPAKLQGWITLETNGATDVKYRFEDDKGALSPVRTANVGALKQNVFSLDFMVGQDPSGQGGPVFQAPANGPVGMNYQAAPTAPNVWQGFYKLKIVEPNSLVSAPANFKVTCKPKVTVDGGIQANPSGPKPATPGSIKASPPPKPTPLKAN